MVRRDAGIQKRHPKAEPSVRQPKTPKGELENNSRNPRDLVRYRHNDSLKRINLLFPRVRRRREMRLVMKMMMRWEPLCQKTEQRHYVPRNCSSALSIYSSSTYQTSKNVWGEYDGQHHTLGRPAEYHTSQLDLIVGCKVSDKTWYFLHKYFETGEDDKAVFSIPSDTIKTVFRDLQGIGNMLPS